MKFNKSAFSVTIILTVSAWIIAAVISLITAVSVNDDAITKILSVDFAVSIISNMLVNLIFFGTFGAITFYYSLKSPSSDTVGQRLRYLFSSQYAAPQPLNYALEQIDRLAAYSKSLHADLYVGEWNESLKAYKVNVKLTNKIVNLYHDKEYIEENIPVNVGPDSFEKDDLVTGQLLMIRVTRGEEKFDYVNFPVDLGKDTLRTAVNFNIKPDDYIILEVGFWLWFAAEQDYGVVLSRWTSQLSVMIHNHSNNVFRMKLRSGELISLEPKTHRNIGTESNLTPQLRLIFTTQIPTLHS